MTTLFLLKLVKKQSKMTSLKVGTLRKMCFSISGQSILLFKSLKINVMSVLIRWDSKVGIWHLLWWHHSLVYQSNRLYEQSSAFINHFCFCFLPGIFVSGPFERRHEAIWCVLFANPGYGLLVPEGVLRTGDCGRRLDGKFWHGSAVNSVVAQRACILYSIII